MKAEVSKVKQPKAEHKKDSKVTHNAGKPKVVAETDVKAVEQPIVHVHEPLKQTFHVGMILLGCGSSIPSSSQDQLNSKKMSSLEERKAKLGTNLYEATSIRVALG